MKMVYKLQWVVNPYRKDKRTGALNPVKPSKYMKSLDVGWKK